jgi:hypothetical protein
MKTRSLLSLHTAVAAALLAWQPASATAQSSSPSELLEKGIYAEETKGDIDVAMTIYQQLIGEARANLSLAAQAQLRLGQCLLKKNRQTEAVAAFEKLIRDFPGEKELVAKAREYLPGELTLGPIPWVDGERLQMNLTLGGGLDIGALELRADLVDSGGKKAWRVGRRMATGGGGGQMLSTVEVDPATFQPSSSYWKMTILGAASGTFKTGEVEIRKEGEPDPKTVRSDKVVYDNEQVMHMLRLLPLEVGYKTTIPVLTTLGGGAILPIGVEVPKKVTVEAPAGTFECFEVVLSVGQSFWVSDDEHRYLVKFDAGGALAHLASISQRKAGSPTAFRDDDLGVIMTAPADWVFHVQRNEKKSPIVHMIDPTADAEHIGLHIKNTDSLPTAARQAPRAFADHDVQSLAKNVQDLKVRPNSWKNYNISGRPGIAFLADYIESGKPKVILSVYAIGAKNCENFTLACRPEKLDALTKSFDQIIASYRATK